MMSAFTAEKWRTRSLLRASLRALFIFFVLNLFLKKKLQGIINFLPRGTGGRGVYTKRLCETSLSSVLCGEKLKGISKNTYFLYPHL